MNLTHVRLLVDNFDACLRFYRDVMELQVRLQTEGEVYAEFETGNCVLAIYKRELMAAAIGEVGRPDPVGIEDRVAVTFDVGDVDAAYAALLARGAEFVAGPTDRPEWFLRTAHLRDPDGNLIELYENKVFGE